MTTLEHLVHTPLAQALGWTLFHSLWQGALAALALAAVLLGTRAARVRYAAACISLLGVAAGFVITLLRLVQTQPASSALGPLNLPPVPTGPGALSTVSTQLHATDILPWLVPFWILGVVLFQARSVTASFAAQRLRNRGVCQAPDPWQQTLARLQATLAITKSVTLLETALSQVPVVIGYLRPAILVPVGMLTAMPAGQIEAILLHELAHVRRHDYLANLIQTIIEGVFFYHPAIWWISGVIRTERENCCDDLVVSTRGQAFEYATALAALEQARFTQPALAATGGNLMKRIQRILFPQPSPRILAPVIPGAILVLTAAFALTAFQPQAAPPQTPYQLWVTQDVAYIITDIERAGFNALQTDADREAFIADFWLFRDPTPGTAENEFKVEHYRRIAYANQHYGAARLPGWKTDRGRIYIVYGPPDEMESHPTATAGKAPYEDWRYRFIQGVGNNVIIEFVDANQSGEYRMTMDPNAKGR